MVSEKLSFDTHSVCTGGSITQLFNLPPSSFPRYLSLPTPPLRLSLVLQGVLHGLHDIISSLPEVLSKVKRLEGVLVQAVEIGTVP